MIENVAKAVTDEPVELAIDIIPKGVIQSILQRIGVIKKFRVFKVRQMTMGSLIRISGLIVQVGEIDFSNPDKIHQAAIDAIARDGDRLAEVVAIAIHNSMSEPPASLKKFILSNFTASEMKDVVSIVLKQMNVQDFIISIVSVKGTQILKTSPADQGS